MKRITPLIELLLYKTLIVASYMKLADQSITFVKVRPQINNFFENKLKRKGAKQLVYCLELGASNGFKDKTLSWPMNINNHFLVYLLFLSLHLL